MKRYFPLILQALIVFLFASCANSFYWNTFEEIYIKNGYICEKIYETEDECLQIEEQIGDSIYKINNQIINIEIERYERFTKSEATIIAIGFQNKSQAKEVRNYVKNDISLMWLYSLYGRVLIITNDVATSKLLDLKFQ